MKKTRKLTLLTVLLLTAAMTLMACTQGTVTPTATGAATAAPTAASQPTAAPTPAGPEMEGNLYLTGLPIVEEQETYTIAVSRHTLDKSSSQNEKVAAIQAEADTNIHIEWIEIESSALSERVNVMLSTSDLPDAFLSCGLSEAQIVKNKDQLVVLNDLIDRYAPVTGALYAQYPDARASLVHTDGNIYTLMISMMVSPDNDANGVQFINTLWLERVGKDMPKTFDEFADVLRAFKTGDPNQNGQADEIPLEFCENNWAAHFTNFMGPFGFVDYYKIEDGEFIATAMTDDFYSFLTYYHTLFEEGLVDPEGFSQTNEQFYAKLKSYVVGSYCGWTPQSNFDAETAKQYNVVVPLTGPDGQRPMTSGQLNKPVGSRTGFAITVDCQSPATLMRWFDYCNQDTATKMTWRLGEEGILWELDADGKVWSIFPENVTADMTRENMKYTYGMYGNSPCLTNPDEVENNDPDKYPESVVRLGFVNAVKDYFPTEVLPLRYVPEDKTNEKALLETEIKAYMNNFVAQSVMNGIDDAGWQAHLAQMEALGVEDWIAWYQGFIDGDF